MNQVPHDTASCGRAGLNPPEGILRDSGVARPSKSLSLSRPFGEGLRFEVQAGQQSYDSPLTTQNSAWWVNSNADWIFSGRYFVGGGFTLYNSPGQGYKQWYVNLGYGF